MTDCVPLWVLVFVGILGLFACFEASYYSKKLRKYKERIDYLETILSNNDISPNDNKTINNQSKGKST